VQDLIKIKPEELKKLILDNHLASAKKLDEIEKSAEGQHTSFQDFLIVKKIVNEKDLVKLYGQAYNIPYVDLTKIEIKKELLAKLPEKIAQRYQAVVFDEKADSLSLAMTDPLDVQAVQFIEKQLGYSTKVYIASSSDISQALDVYNEGLSSEISKVIKESEDISIEEGQIDATASAENVQEIVQEAPIARALSIILEYAAKSRASDIHIEPREGFIQVRYRIDGILQDTMTLPRQILSAIVTRIKILSNLRIDEHRIPQDGRIKVKFGARVISIRVSTLPIVDGEKVVMRLLDETNKAPTLEELGYSGTALMGIKNALAKPHGMLLVTGPTGSGKSTTLYSAISTLNSIEVNISTVEDPIEYKIQGVNQTQVNVKTGMTFASGLRALLRQDPDIIMVGEIRDTETAEMAVHAALTGHVVLSTLHTNNAAGCLPRLLDMKVEPFLIASTVNAVIGQRLVRRLCPDCQEPYQVTKEQIEEVINAFDLDRNFLYTTPPKEVVREVEKQMNNFSEKTIPAPKSIEQKYSILDQIAKDPSIINRSLTDAENQEGKSLREQIFVQPNEEKKTPVGHNLSLTLFKAVGCKKCNMSGYSGRLGIYEVLEVTDKIGEMIVTHTQSDEIEIEAIKNGMITMAQDGFIKSLIGITTVEEVMRVTKE
jgi:type IV pilus assembly protein PilB